MTPTRALLLLAALASCTAAAQPVDPTTLYDLTTDGPGKPIKAGEKGLIVIAINAKNGAHVSDEAPLRIELKSEQFKLEKQKLTLEESTTRKSTTDKYPNPRFEIPVSAPAAVKGQVEAKMTFFICTDKLCARQQKTVSVPVEVN